MPCPAARPRIGHIKENPTPAAPLPHPGVDRKDFRACSTIPDRKERLLVAYC